MLTPDFALVKYALTLGTGPGVFGPWTSLGAPAASGGFQTLAVGTNANGIEQVFAVAGAAAPFLYELQQPSAGTWSGAAPWKSLGGGFKADVAVTLNAKGLLDAFAIDGAGFVWTYSQTSLGNFSLSMLGSRAAGIGAQSLAVGTNVDHIEQVFAVGAAAAPFLYELQQPSVGTWSGAAPWKSLGGGYKPDVAVTLNAKGLLDVFAIDGAGFVWTYSQTSLGKFSLSMLGSRAAGIGAQSLAGGTTTNNTEQVFAVGTNHTTYELKQQGPAGAWGAWAPCPGMSNQDVAVARNAQGQLDVFVINDAGNVCLFTETTPTYQSPWISLGD